MAANGEIGVQNSLRGESYSQLGFMFYLIFA